MMKFRRSQHHISISLNWMYFAGWENLRKFWTKSAPTGEVCWTLAQLHSGKNMIRLYRRKNSMICTVITSERVSAMHGRQARSISWLDLVNKDGVTYILKPQMQYFTELDCTLPVGSNGVMRLVWDGEILEITPNADGGILELGEQKLSLVRGETRRVKI